MKKLSLIFISVLVLASCTVEDNRTMGQGKADCPLCQGKGYFKKTDFFIFETYYDCACKVWNNGDSGSSDVTFRGAQTGYTGPCSKCTCPAYDRSPDGICDCGHYKTDHKWHN